MSGIYISGIQIPVVFQLFFCQNATYSTKLATTSRCGKAALLFMVAAVIKAALLFMVTAVVKAHSCVDTKPQ